MSKSARRLLRRAADALAELEEIRQKYPDVEREVTAMLGAEGVARIEAAAAVVRAAAERAEVGG